MNYGSRDIMVGDAYKGGTVGYILKSGDPGYNANQTKGLIISNNVIPPEGCSAAGWPWDFKNVGDQPNLTSLSAAIGQGANNSDIIKNSFSYNPNNNCTKPAAVICLDYSTGSDLGQWYLGSLDEMRAIAENAAYLPNWGLEVWTSTQYDQNYAYTVNGAGATGTALKWSDGVQDRQIRPIKSF